MKLKSFFLFFCGDSTAFSVVVFLLLWLFPCPTGSRGLEFKVYSLWGILLRVVVLISLAYVCSDSGIIVHVCVLHILLVCTPPVQ